MHGIENRLDRVASGSDYAARSLHYEVVTQRFTFKAKAPNVIELLTIPAGSYYQLMHWTWQSSAEVRPALFLNSAAQLLDCGAPGFTTEFGRVDVNEIIVPERQALMYGQVGGPESDVTLVLQFRVYEIQPPYRADVVAAE
jgi:hypothetical protein